MIFEPVSIDPVATWTYDVQEEICNICKNNLMEPCINCSASGKKEDCNLAKGRCGHGFHSHCIKEGLKANDNCPTDHTGWHYETENLDARDKWCALYAEHGSVPSVKDKDKDKASSALVDKDKGSVKK